MYLLIFCCIVLFTVYSGYGKYLVVWSSATGDIVKTIEMPPVNVTNQSPSSPIDSTVKLSSSVMAPYPYWQPEPYIQMLLLHEGRLLVIVGGYGQMHWKMSPMGEPENVISDLLSTHFRIYDTAAMLSSASTLPDAGLVGTKDENGLFNAIRSVNGNVHVVATSYLNTYPYLVRPLEVYNFATNITTKEYQQIVEEVAPDLGVNFTMQLMRDLKAGGATPRMTRINLWSETAAASGIEELSYPSGLMNSMVLVHSFNMASQTVGAALTMTSSGSFVPGWVQTYSSIDRIILAAGVYEYDDVTQVSKVSTALIAFGLEGASSVPQSIGTVPGSALSSYSLDVVGNFLRIATTVQNDTWIMIDSMMEVEVSDATDVNSTDVDNGNASTTDVYVDPVFTPPDTENYIIVMSLPGANGTEPGAMVEQGRVKIGKPKESITAMRFFDNIAYAVTFEKKDPLYVLDLSNPAAPTIVGELEISGYSGYLHPINADNTMILAIGEEADAEGNILGLQLSLFDMTVPSSPKNVSRFNIEFDANTSSYSEALWDPKAVRYADGLLFLPVNIANYYDASATTPFTGTMVFKVDSTTGITEVNQCRVANYVEEMDPYVTDMMSDTMSSDMMSPNTTLTNSTTPCNYTGGYLPTRSMVFNGNLMTTYYSEVIMTNLDTCQRLWNMTIGIPVPAGCPTYFM